MNILTTDLGRWGRLSVFPASSLSNLAKISLLQFSSCLLKPGSPKLRNGRPILQIIYQYRQNQRRRWQTMFIKKLIKILLTTYCTVSCIIQFSNYISIKCIFNKKKKIIIIQTLSTFLNLKKVGSGPTFWGLADSIKGLSEKNIG